MFNSDRRLSCKMYNVGFSFEKVTLCSSHALSNLLSFKICTPRRNRHVRSDHVDDEPRGIHAIEK